LRYKKQKNFPINKGTNNDNNQEEIFSESGITTLSDLSALGKEKIEIRFSLEETCCYGGLLLLRETDNRIGHLG